jgi:hypothetical protein
VHRTRGPHANARVERPPRPAVRRRAGRPGRGTSAPTARRAGAGRSSGAPDVAQLRRAVGGEHDHRHVRQPGLDDRRVEVGRRGAARAQQHAGTPSRPRPSATNAADRSSCTTWTRARARRRARAPSACCAIRVRRRRGATPRDPLVDEGGAERRVASDVDPVMTPDDTAPYARNHDRAPRRRPDRQCRSRCGPTSSARGATSASDASSAAIELDGEIDVDVRLPPVPARPDRIARQEPARCRGLRQEVRRPGARRGDHRPTSPRRRGRRDRVPHGPRAASQHAARPPPPVVGRAARLPGRQAST